jgi:hypothetical protein
MDNFALTMQKIQCQEALTRNLLDQTCRKSTTTKLVPQGQQGASEHISHKTEMIAVVTSKIKMTAQAKNMGNARMV